MEELETQNISLNEEVTILTQSKDQLLLEAEGWNERLDHNVYYRLCYVDRIYLSMFGHMVRPPK